MTNCVMLSVRWMTMLAVCLTLSLSCHAQKVDAAQPGGDTPRGVDSPGQSPLTLAAERIHPDAPAIAECSRMVRPGETIVVTGARLEGAKLHIACGDKTVIVDPIKSDDNKLLAVLPELLPAAMMTIHPVKEGPGGARLFGAPIRINAAEAFWSWPCRVEARDTGRQTVRLFGRNLDLGEHATPVVTLSKAIDDPRLLNTAQPLEIVTREPYHLEARLPDGLGTGAYRLHVHNGAGGTSGWGAPVTFEVVEPRPGVDKTFDVNTFIRDAKGDVDDGIAGAIAAAQKAGGGTVRFGGRLYVINRPIVVPEGPPVVLKGIGMGEWDARLNRLSGKATHVRDYLAHLGRFKGREMFDVQARGSRIEDMHITLGSIEWYFPEGKQGGVYVKWPTPNAVVLAGEDQSLVRCRLTAVNDNTELIVCRGGARANQRVTGCEIHLTQRGLILDDRSNYVRIDNCSFVGHYRTGVGLDNNAVMSKGGHHFVMERCRFRGFDPKNGQVLCRTILMNNSAIRCAYMAHNESRDMGMHASVPAANFGSGEQYLFHQWGPLGGVFRVVSSDGAKLTLDADAGVTRQDARFPAPMDLSDDGRWVVFVASGAGAGQWRAIAKHEKERVTVSPGWRIEPEKGALVKVQRVFRHNIIYGNTVDAMPDPEVREHSGMSTGCTMWFLTVDNIVANNRFAHLGKGVTMYPAPDRPTAWNEIRDNAFVEIGGAAARGQKENFVISEKRFIPWPGTPIEEDRGWAGVGNAFRNNTAEGCDGPAGHISYHRILVYDPAKVPELGPDRGVIMPVVEGNTFKGMAGPFMLGAPAVWPVVRENVFEVKGGGAPVEFKEREQAIGPVLEDNRTEAAGD